MAISTFSTTVLCLLGGVFLSDATAQNWDSIRSIIQAGIDDRAFPGAVAMVSDNTGTLFLEAFGNFTYGEFPSPLNGNKNPSMVETTLFDMASLTKVVATTSCVMSLYQRGFIQLDDKVSRYLGDGFAAQGKGDITVLNLLLHNSGFPPDPTPNFWSKEFRCPDTVASKHPAETFSCQQKVFDALLNQSLLNPIGERFVYSDLSMITMMYVVGTAVVENNLVSLSDLRHDCVGLAKTNTNEGVGIIAQCYYEAFVRTKIFGELGMTQSGFLPSQQSWSQCAPTWNDTERDAPGNVPYRLRVVQGQVSDGNSYALGGIAGHAGLFSTAEDAMKLARALVQPHTTPHAFANQTTVDLFTTIHNTSQSSRALGWDTNDYTMNTYRGCANFSAKTYTHTGYTGTQICNDPTIGVTTVLLTNRVYPIADENSELKIHAYRQKFNDGVLKIVKPMI